MAELISRRVIGKGILGGALTLALPSLSLAYNPKPQEDIRTGVLIISDDQEIFIKCEPNNFTILPSNPWRARRYDEFPLEGKVNLYIEVDMCLPTNQFQIQVLDSGKMIKCIYCNGIFDMNNWPLVYPHHLLIRALLIEEPVIEECCYELLKP